MKRALTLCAFLTFLAMAPSAMAQDHDPGEYGSLWLGPRVGGVVGFSGPRGGYFVGLELSYRTPRYFYYNIELGFMHLLPRTISVDATTQEEVDGSETVLSPAHDVKVTGLYGLPLTLEIGLRLDVGRARLRLGVGFGAMLTIQSAEAMGNEQSELIVSFCFRPGIGVDVSMNEGEGLLRFDLAYLWQDANFEVTGNDRDVDSLLLTVGYSWMMIH